MRVLITGGSSGIGLDIARAYLARGADVALVARDLDKLASARDTLLALFPSARVLTRSVDIVDRLGAKSAVDSLVKDLGGLDVLINNAGSMTLGRFSEISLDKHLAAFEANFFGHVTLTHLALPYLKASKRGHVAFVSSVAGFLGVYGYSAYSPAKFALTGLAECLRQEFRDFGVGVSVAFPPDTQTPMLDFERQHGLAETKALGGAVKPKTSQAVADGIVAGISSGRFEIFFERESRLFRVIKAVVPSLYGFVVDRIIASSRKTS